MGVLNCVQYKTALKKMKGNWLKNFSLLVITISFSILICESIVSILRADLVAIKPLLYLVEGDFAYEDGAKIMEVAENPHIIYRIKNTEEVRCTNCAHPKEKGLKVISYRFSGNHSRIVKSSQQQVHGSEKIFIIGGSYTFGVSTIDDLTVPNMIQEYLNKRKLGISVIDRSASAYVTSQKIAIAEALINEYGVPKAILIQQSNTGRRAFLYDEVCDEVYGDKICEAQNRLLFKRHFDGDEELYRENFPNFLGLSIHNELVVRSGLYRFIVALYYRYKFTKINSKCIEEQKWICFSGEFAEDFARYADEYSQRRLQQFASTWGNDTKIIVYMPIRIDSCDSKIPLKIVHKKNYKIVQFCLERTGVEYYDIHPPTYVYEWYRELYEEIIDIVLTFGE